MSAKTKRSTVAALALIFASAIAVDAAPQHGGFGRGYTGHRSERAPGFVARPEVRRFDVDGRFRFIGFPLKIKGGTGSPIRAVALFDD